jgi:hypothetical protein
MISISECGSTNPIGSLQGVPRRRCALVFSGIWGHSSCHRTIGHQAGGALCRAATPPAAPPSPPPRRTRHRTAPHRLLFPTRPPGPRPIPPPVPKATSPSPHLPLPVLGTGAEVWLTDAQLPLSASEAHRGSTALVSKCVLRQAIFGPVAAFCYNHPRMSYAGEVRERPNRHDWKSCVQQCTVGSNPTLSAVHLTICRSRRMIMCGCARRGASGALYPQSAIAGSNSPLRLRILRN